MFIISYSQTNQYGVGQKSHCYQSMMVERESFAFVKLKRDTKMYIILYQWRLCYYRVQASLVPRPFDGDKARCKQITAQVDTCIRLDVDLTADTPSPHYSHGSPVETNQVSQGSHHQLK